MQPCSHRAVLVLYGIAGMLLYAKSLGYPMVFDDLLYLVENPLFTEFRHFQELFTQFSHKVVCLAPLGKDGDVSANFALRPLTYFSFFLNHSIGGLNPTGYRALNVIIHCTNAFLTFRLSLILLRAPIFPRQSDQTYKHFAAVATGLFFLIHPLQTESVTYIIQRATSLSAMFYLMSIVLHLDAPEAPQGISRTATFLSVLCAMLSKESGFTAPFLAVLLEWLVLRAPLRTALRRGAPLLILTPVVPLMLVAVSMSQKGTLSLLDLLHVSATEGSKSQSVPYALTQPSVWLGYLQLFFWPSGLNIDPEVAPVSSPFHWRFWSALLLLVSIPLAALVALRKRFFPDASLAMLLGFGWFAFTIAPDSTLVPLPDLMAEHRSYLPLFGLCFFAAVSLAQAGNILSRTKVRWHTQFTALTLLLPTTALCVSTIQRNDCWATRSTLWQDTCNKSPGKIRPWINLANAYLESNQLSEAQHAIEQSIAVQPTGIAYANLSSILLRADKSREALEASLKALDCPPSGYDFFVYSAVGRCYAHLQQWSEAVPFLIRALDASAGHFESAHLLAVAYSNLGAHHQAHATLTAALRYHPGDSRLLSWIQFCEAKLREIGDATPARINIQVPSNTAPQEPYKLRLGFQ
jgi:tetratricopeptide (TPR) repeat protein